MNHRSLFAISLAAATAVACGGDRSGDEPEKAPPKGEMVDFKKQQEAFADSVLNTVAPPRVVVERLGKGYEVGSLRMRDTVALLVSKTNCFAQAREVDPYLAGTVSFWVNMNVIGSDVVQVQESDTKWTSVAGNIASTCLNQAARKWQFEPSFGKPAAYIVQVQMKSGDAAAATATSGAKKP